MATTHAKDWYTDPKDFLRVCSDAISQAKGEGPEEFTHEMMVRAKQYGLETRITEPQLKWLCKIADAVMPKMKPPKQYGDAEV